MRLKPLLRISSELFVSLLYQGDGCLYLEGVLWEKVMTFDIQEPVLPLKRLPWTTSPSTYLPTMVFAVT